MNLQAGKTVNHVHAVAFHLFGPVDVLLFVKTGFELNHRSHLFAAAARFEQILGDRRIASCAIQRLLNRDNVRITSSLLQKFKHAVERVIRMVDHDVMLADLVKAAVVRVKRLEHLRMVGRIFERGTILFHQTAEFRERERNSAAINLARKHVQMRVKKVLQTLRHAALNLKTNHRAETALFNIVTNR